MLLIFLLAILVSSCTIHRDVVVGHRGSQGIRIQECYSSCCGLNSRRFVVDEFNGTNHSLFAPYSIDGYFCDRHPMKIVAHYSKNKITRIEEFTPVFDTTVLSKFFTREQYLNWLDTSINNKTDYLPLTKTDSILIFQLPLLLTDSTINTNYICAIKGFVFKKQHKVFRNFRRIWNYDKLKTHRYSKF